MALAVTAIAVWVRWLIDPWLGGNLALVTLFAAVPLAFWLGGVWAALFAVVVGYLACDYLFIGPPGGFGLDQPADRVGFLAYLVSCSAIVGFGQAMRVAKRRATEGRELLRVTLASIGDAVITTDLRARVTQLNPVAESLTGWTTSEARGRPLDEVFRIVDEVTRAVVENPALRALREGAVVGLANHTVLLSRDGVERPIDDSAAPIRDGSGRVRGCVLVFRDVGERRRVDRALRRNEQELSDFFENATVALHWVGPDGTILRVNRAELDMLGYSHDEYVGHPVAEFHADRSVVDDVLPRILRGEAVHERPARMRCKDGSVKDVLLTSSALFEDGAFVHSRCFTIDVTERKEFEEALGSLAAIVAASDDAIVSKTLEGIIRSWNAGAERLFGYSADEAVGRSIELIIPPELLGEERSILARLRRGERIDHFESVRLRKDGRRIDISLTVSPIRDHAGRVIGASKVARDVTERKRADEALRESEERYRALVESQTEMVCRFRSDGTILFVNGAYASALGKTPEALEGANFWDFVAEDQRQDVQAMLDRLTPEAPEAQIENSLATTTGRRWTLWTNRALKFDTRGKVAEAQSVGIDITKRKWAEEQLRESEARFRTVADSAPVLIWLNDPSGCTFVNRAYLEFVGARDQAEVGGSAWTKYVHQDDLERYLSAYRDASERQEKFMAEVRLRRHDGAYRWMQSAGVARFTTAGVFLGYTGCTYDVHDARNAAAALREADRRKDEFIATLAHELRNPLAPIGNSLELLRHAENDRDVLEAARTTIARQLAHVVRLVDDLLDVSRITRDKLALRKTRTELGPILEHALETCRPAAEREGHRVETVLPEYPVFLEADPVRLTQVFSNLLDNACKYTPRRGTIRLVARLEKDEVVVSVTDSGLGLPPGEIDGIFEMFSQIEPTLERSGSGLGIGLTLVRRLVDLHGGSVVAHSEGLGHGSEFVVRLPLALAGDPSPSLARVADGGSAPRRILVVDDNRDNATSLVALLELGGHEVRSAYDGTRALEVAEELHPEAVLLDIGLPDLDGHEVCRRLRARPWAASTRVIALTGWGQAEDQRRSKEAGFDVHLVKPVDFDELKRLVAGPRPVEGSP